MLGRAYLMAGRIREAAPQLQRATEALPRSAIIAADYSLVLAAQQYMSSAIQKANQAKTLAGNDTGLIAYLDEQIGIWEAAVEEEARQKAEEDAERRKALEEARQQREAERAAEQELEAKEAAEDAAKEAETTEAAEDGDDADDEDADDDPPSTIGR